MYEVAISDEWCRNNHLIFFNTVWGYSFGFEKTKIFALLENKLKSVPLPQVLHFFFQIETAFEFSQNICQVCLIPGHGI